MSSRRKRTSGRTKQSRKTGGRTSRKLVGLFLIVILALVGLAGRITYINVTQGEKYSRIVLSQAQQRYESRTIPFRRGDILDRNGTILATSEKVYNVILDCKVVNDTITTITGEKEKRYYEPTVKALRNVLHIRENEVRALLDGEEIRDSQYQILAQNVSITDKKAFEAY
ncbi:MAG: cell division protein FtsI, partial [Eubacterium sp.]|nr:cell division protein FtsI [Eubacterium sp.]